MCLFITVRSTQKVEIHGCDNLAERADPDAPVWELSPQGCTDLAAALDAALGAAFWATVEAVAGETCDAEERVTRQDLLVRVRANRLGNRVRYVVSG